MNGISLSRDVLFFHRGQPNELTREASVQLVPTPYPVAFAVINLPRFLFSFARSAIIGESRTSVSRLQLNACISF